MGEVRTPAIRDPAIVVELGLDVAAALTTRDEWDALIRRTLSYSESTGNPQ